MDVVQHTKMMPECRNVTKQNCITKWQEDANGNQVWAGNEDCEPVTWRECKLVPRQVDFKVPKINCEDGEEIPYTDMEPTEKTQMTTKMTCVVKHTKNCSPIASTKCQSINYQECAEIPNEVCENVEMSIPHQDKEHKKKCLLPDDATGAAPSARGAKALGQIVAAAKAQEATAQESRRSFAKPLPLSQNHQNQRTRQGRNQFLQNQSTFNQRRGSFQSQQTKFRPVQQTKFQPQAGSFVRGQ